MNGSVRWQGSKSEKKVRGVQRKEDEGMRDGSG